MSVHQIWAAVVVVVTVSGVAVALSLANKDPNTFLVICGLVITPIVTALLVRGPVAEVREKLATVSDTLGSVEQKVNGHLTEIVKKIPDAIPATNEETIQ